MAVGPVYQGQSTTAATTPGVAGESTHYTSTLIEVNGLRVLPLLLIPVALTALALVTVLVSESRQGTRKVALWGLAVLFLDSAWWESSPSGCSMSLRRSPSLFRR